MDTRQAACQYFEWICDSQAGPFGTVIYGEYAGHGANIGVRFRVESFGLGIMVLGVRFTK